MALVALYQSESARVKVAQAAVRRWPLAIQLLPAVQEETCVSPLDVAPLVVQSVSTAAPGRMALEVMSTFAQARVVEVMLYPLRS